jgi:4-amino-4-deoxy-L-arabinose transferase-like glycosyltransferase
MYGALAVFLIAARPPWEAPDEVDHVKNVQTLASGRIYRIRHEEGLEANQPPLYYGLLAGWQRVLGIPTRTPTAVASVDCAQDAFFRRKARCALFRHDTPIDGDAHRRLALLRLPGILFGAVTILLTAATARRLTSDPWTPVVAGAIVASVPAFIFLSAGVNNDNLANPLGAAATLLAVVAVQQRDRGGRRWPVALGLGLIVGALILTKFTALVLVPALLVAVLLSTRNRRQAGQLLLALSAVAVLVSSWWLVHNVSEYGDPFALEATEDYFHEELPLAFSTEPPLERAVVSLPGVVWKEFWYRSQQFMWPWWAYLPFWLLAAGGLAALVANRRRWGPSPDFGLGVIVLTLLGLGALATMWLVGLNTNTAQARLTFTGLAAIACLIALGFECLRVPVPARFALPAIGFMGTLVALRSDVIDVYL